MDVDRLTKHLADSIPLGPHPEPHAEWVQVRLDVVQSAIDTVDWLNKGLLEWRALHHDCAAQLRIALRERDAARAAWGTGVRWYGMSLKTTHVRTLQPQRDVPDPDLRHRR